MLKDNEITRRIAAHFAAQEVRVIAVPEWDCVIHARPLTLADHAALAPWLEGNKSEGLARVIIRKATDGDGKALFDSSDLKVLMDSADANVIARVATQILRTDQEEDDPGNS